MSVWGIFNFFLWAYPLHWVNSLIFHIRGTCHFQCSWVVDAWSWVQWVLNRQLAGLTPGQSIMFSSETHVNRFWENFTNTCLLIYEAATLFIISSYSIRLCLGSIDWRIGEGFFFPLLVWLCQMENTSLQLKMLPVFSFLCFQHTRFCFQHSRSSSVSLTSAEVRSYMMPQVFNWILP